MNVKVLAYCHMCPISMVSVDLDLLTAQTPGKHFYITLCICSWGKKFLCWRSQDIGCVIYQPNILGTSGPRWYLTRGKNDTNCCPTFLSLTYVVIENNLQLQLSNNWQSLSYFCKYLQKKNPISRLLWYYYTIRLLQENEGAFTPA